MKTKFLALSSSTRRRFLNQLGLGTIIAGTCKDAWADHSPPFARVPPEFSRLHPDLRSTLIFDDGSRVKTAEDWNRRRIEIRSAWHRVIGQWPPIVDGPKIEIIETTIRGNVKQQRVRVQIASDQTSDGYILIPSGDGPFPAVFVPYYEPETSIGISDKPLRDFAWQLSQRGFVSLSIGSPGGDARMPVLGEQARCQPLSYLGYIAANAWNALASMDVVDSTRIGIVGHSYGGKWAMFGSCLYDKYACAVWSDPGIVFDETRPSINYQEPWYLGLDAIVTRKPGLIRDESPRTGAYKTLIDLNHNLHELHALMAPRPFLVSGGEEDPPKRWEALNHAIAVNKILGFDGRVAMTNRATHSPTEESNEQIYQFFDYWLAKSLTTKPRSN